MRRFYPVFFALAFLASSCIFSPSSGDTDSGPDVVDTTEEDVIEEDVTEEDTTEEDTIEEDTIEEDVGDVEVDADACGGCEGETPYCDTDSGTCVECLTQAECDGQEVCSAAGKCVTCTEAQGCGEGVCVVDEADAANNVCTECEDEEDCSDDEVCVQGGNITDNVCAACVEGDGCEAGQVCAVDAADASNNVCVGCLGDEDCAGEQVCSVDPDDASENVCVGCLDDEDCANGVCIAGTTPGENACEACREASDCTEADAAACDTATNTCVACGGDDDCAGVSGLGVCDGGLCVECVDDSDCGGKVCDQTDNTCTTIDPGTAEVCETCVSDTECPQDHYCVPMDFAGTAHGNYCLEVFDANLGCAGPFGVGETKTSLGGVNDEFCSLNEDLATCEALESLKSGDSNQCAFNGMPDDSQCGASGVDDGLCRTVGVLANKCTYACSQDSDCPDLNGKRLCGNDRSGGTGPEYCGGGL